MHNSKLSCSICRNFFIHVDMDNVRWNFCWKTPIVQEKVLGVTQQLIAPYKFKKFSWAEYVWYKIAELENLLFNLFAIFKAEVCRYEEHPRTFSWEMLMYKEVIGCCTWLHDYIRDWARLTLLTWTLKKDTTSKTNLPKISD